MICEENLKVQSLMDGFTVRIKIPNSLETSIKDIVQGKVTVKNEEIDNFIILRKDGSPTYLLSAVVDDFDMGINLVIRGDDHLNNTFRQFYIYNNMNWQIPEYAHIPLIHGEDGKKLSKRHGAVDTIELREQGYLKESIINNLILLGWSTPNSREIISIDEIINLFNIKKISKSSSIFNYDKLNFFNKYFIEKDTNNTNLLEYSNLNLNIKNYLDLDKDKFLKIFKLCKNNINSLIDLEGICKVYYETKFQTVNNTKFTLIFNELLKDFYKEIIKLKTWELNEIDIVIKEFIKNKEIKFFEFGKPFRLLLTNLENGPSLSDILYILGKKNTVKRIESYINSKY